VKQLLVFIMLIMAMSVFAGPLGFEKGMTLEQLQTIDPEMYLADNSETIWIMTKAPQATSAFDIFLVNIHPEIGLFSVRLISKDINCGAFGEGLVTEYNRLKELLTNNYGPASNFIDNINRGSIWSDARYYMMSLLQKDRKLLAIWTDKAAMPADLDCVLIEAAALSSTVGYIYIQYYMEGHDEILDSLNATGNI